MNLRPLAALALLLCACASTAPVAAAEPIAIDSPAIALEGERYLETRVGVHIDAAPEAVWAVLVDGPSYPAWNSTVTSLDGTIALGETIELVSTIDPKRTFSLEVTTFEPGARLVWEDGGRAFKGVRTFTLTAREDGTTDLTVAEVMTGSMMGMIAPKLPDFRPSFDTFATDLQAEVAARRGA
ncbi:MAG: SRPBCC domain-containing protein [Myxococcota bacterium]